MIQNYQIMACFINEWQLNTPQSKYLRLKPHAQSFNGNSQRELTPTTII